MTLQFLCKGCRHERTEPESDHARKGYCTGCNASGIGLPQIHKVDKWEARDGSLHDTLSAAKQHQLMADLTTALRAWDGYPDHQSRHLLSHFDITRKGDKSHVSSVVVSRPFPVAKQVCKTCIFVMGAFAGAVVCVMVLQAKGLIV